MHEKATPKITLKVIPIINTLINSFIDITGLLIRLELTIKTKQEVNPVISGNNQGEDNIFAITMRGVLLTSLTSRDTDITYI